MDVINNEVPTRPKDTPNLGEKGPEIEGGSTFFTSPHSNYIHPIYHYYSSDSDVSPLTITTSSTTSDPFTLSDSVLSAHSFINPYSSDPMYCFPDPFSYMTYSDILLDPSTNNPASSSTPSTSDRIPNSRGRRAGKDGDPRRRHKCTYPGCSDAFIRRDHLRRHMVAHAGERAFYCHVCGKSFNRADNMNTHIRTMHNGA